MSNISDLIEGYLKKLLAESSRNYVEVQRCKLAISFNCVPSQINYVLTTRFSTGHGYIVESRRGGGGYIKIVKLPFEQSSGLILDICSLIGDSISQAEAGGLIERLLEEELITSREARVMKAAVVHGMFRPGLAAPDRLRAIILKGMIMAVLQE